MRTLIFLTLLLAVNLGRAQTHSLPPILKKLAETNGVVQTKTILPEPLIPNIPPPFSNNFAHMVKTPESLLATIEGTGFVFKYDTSVCRWIRIDSTIYHGYNNRSYSFYTGNTLYSYGGTGLFNTNGALRYFSTEKSEWEAVLLNREIPHVFESTDNYYLDTTNNRFYLTGLHSYNPIIKSNRWIDSRINNRVWMLDLEKRDWHRLGHAKDTGLAIVGISPWGMLFNAQMRPDIADFENNRYLWGTENARKKFTRFFRSLARPSIAYFIDSTLFFGNYSGYIDSVKFSQADFYDSGIPIYSSPEPIGINPQKIMISFVVLSLVALNILLLVKLRRRKRPSVGVPASTGYPRQNFRPTGDPQDYRSSRLPDMLDEKEKWILEFILQQSRYNRVVSIEELNKILGVTHKSLEIQKRQRSDTLSSINQKLAHLSQNEHPVIDKRRSLVDKRSFEYFIHPDLFEELEEILKG